MKQLEQTPGPRVEVSLCSDKGASPDIEHINHSRAPGKHKSVEPLRIAGDVLALSNPTQLRGYN